MQSSQSECGGFTRANQRGGYGLIPIPNTSTITTSEASSANIGGSIIPQPSTLGLCKLYETKWQKEHLWGPDDEEGN